MNTPQKEKPPMAHQEHLKAAQTKINEVKQHMAAIIASDDFNTWSEIYKDKYLKALSLSVEVAKKIET